MSDSTTPAPAATAPAPPVKKDAAKPAKPAATSKPRVWFRDPVTGVQKLRGADGD